MNGPRLTQAPSALRTTKLLAVPASERWTAAKGWSDGTRGNPGEPRVAATGGAYTLPGWLGVGLGMNHLRSERPPRSEAALSGRISRTEPVLGGDADSVTLPRLISPNQLADYLGVPIGTIYRWTSKRDGSGPEFSRLGKHVRFDAADVQSWLEAKRIEQRVR